MERWSGKVAVVTGASSGIGSATVKALIENGLIVVGLARRVKKMESELADVPNIKGKFYPVKCDVSDDIDVAKAFDWIKKNVGKVQVLVNNAGTFEPRKFTNVSNEKLKDVLTVNVMGPVYCTKETLKVIQTDKLEGHIININSILGHNVILPPGLHVNIYPASKHAITGFTESLIKELQGENVRVTSVSPGMVMTEMTTGLFPNMPHLKPEDLASAIVYVLGTPQRMHIKELTVSAHGGF